MRTVSFTVPGQPVAKGRSRATKSGMHFTPEKTRRYENQVSAYAAEAMRHMPLIGSPVEIVVDAYMMIPASWSIKKKGECIAGKIKPAVRPDLDNILKAVFDGINGVIIVDDGLVVKITASKHYAEKPQLLVTVIGQE